MKAQPIISGRATQAEIEARVALAIQQLDQVTQQNTTSAEALASGAGELSAEADQLKEAVAFFRADQVGQATGAPKPSMKAGRSASKPALRVVRPAQGFGFDLSDADDGLDAGFQRSVTG